MDCFCLQLCQELQVNLEKIRRINQNNWTNIVEFRIIMGVVYSVNIDSLFFRGSELWICLRALALVASAAATAGWARPLSGCDGKAQAQIHYLHRSRCGRLTSGAAVNWGADICAYKTTLNNVRKFALEMTVLFNNIGWKGESLIYVNNNDNNVFTEVKQNSLLSWSLSSCDWMGWTQERATTDQPLMWKISY